MQPDERLGELRDRLERFVHEASAGGSPLYERLSAAAARDEVALELLASAPDERQRRANLLFAAVHDVLLEDPSHPLARYYPSVGGHRPPEDGAEETFRCLLRDRHDELMRRVTNRATQTNEVARCAALWPALRRVAERLGGPIVLVEAGSSAGLLLHLDRYRYDLGGAYPGPASSPVVIAPDVVGPPPPAGGDPDVVRRIGIDRSPLDPADPADARWLQACVWPEHTGRLAQLRAALEVAREHDDVETVAGDLLATLPGVLGDLPDDVVPVVFHSAALAYLDAEGRGTVLDTLADAGRRRDLAWISLEGPFLPPFADLAERDPQDGEVEVAFLLGLSVWRGGAREDALLGRSHPHGRWLQWLAPAEGG